MKRTATVIQARMGSTRCPGKMLAEIAGQPLIGHIIDRARHIPGIDAIVLATSIDPRDDVLEHFGLDAGIAVVRGSETNVMERFLLAADTASAEYLVRVCGDAPFFDPALLGRALAMMLAEDLDVVLKGDGPAAHQGAEVVSVRALRWSRQQAPDDPAVSEHVTLYARRNHARLRTGHLVPDPALAGRYKLSIDTADDLAFARRIYETLYRPGKILDLVDVVGLIQRDPALAAENERLYRLAYGR